MKTAMRMPHYLVASATLLGLLLICSLQDTASSGEPEKKKGTGPTKKDVAPGGPHEAKDLKGSKKTDAAPGGLDHKKDSSSKAADEKSTKDQAHHKKDSSSKITDENSTKDKAKTEEAHTGKKKEGTEHSGKTAASKKSKHPATGESESGAASSGHASKKGSSEGSTASEEGGAKSNKQGSPGTPKANNNKNSSGSASQGSSAKNPASSNEGSEGSATMHAAGSDASDQPKAVSVVKMHIQILQEETNALVRKRIVIHLGKMKSDALQAIPALIMAGHKDKDKDVRATAYGVVTANFSTPEIIDALLGAVNDKTQDASLRQGAIEALANFHIKGRAVSPEYQNKAYAGLEGVLIDSDPDIRVAAAKWLETIDARASTATKTSPTSSIQKVQP